MITGIKKQYEKFLEAKKNKEGFGTLNVFIETFLVYIVIMLVIFCVAIYLSIKCNKGINFIDFLFAFFCAPIYLLYRIILGCNNQ